MQVWELMAILSKAPAGAEICGAQGDNLLTSVVNVDVQDEGLIQMYFEVPEEE